MSLAFWSQLWKSGRTLAVDKLNPRREPVTARDRRRLHVDPLEQRQMFAVSPLGTEFQVNNAANSGLVQQFAPLFSAQSTRSVAVDHDGDFVVAWTSYNQDGDGAGVFARVFSRTGAPLTDEFQVNQFTAGDQLNASVAMDGDGDFVITWESSLQDPYDSSSGIYARRFRLPPAAGLPAAVGDPEFRVHTNQVDTQRNPAVAMNNIGQFVIAWQNESQAGSFFNDVRAQVYDEDGNPVGGEFRVNQNNFPSGGSVDANPDVGMDAAGNFAISWEVGLDISYRVFNVGGSPRTNELQANVSDANFVEQPFATPNNFGHDPKLGAANRYQGNAQLAMDTAGNFIIVWESFQDNDVVTTNDIPDSLGIYWRRFQADGTPAAARDSAANRVHTLDPNSNTDPDRGITFNQSTGGFTSFTETYAGPQVHPSVSIDADGDLGIVWRGYNGSFFGQEVQTLEFEPGTNVFGPRLPNGQAATPTFTIQMVLGFQQVTTEQIPYVGTPAQIAAAIQQALIDVGFPGTFVTTQGPGQFTVTFAPGQNVSQMVITNNFMFEGPPPPIDQTDNRPMVDVTVETETDGPVGYQNAGIWLKRYLPSAEFPARDPQSGAIRTETPGQASFQQIVNTTNTNAQGHPAIAYEPDGDFVVVWDGAGATDTQGIFAQRFNESTDAAGPLATEVLINGARVKTGDTIAQSAVNAVVVRFDEQLNTTNGASGTFSVMNRNNWVLEGPNGVITGGVTNISFGLNPATNKWEAVVSLDGNGSALPGNPALPNGSYQLRALNSIRDVAGNPLGGSGYTPNGVQFVRQFNVQLPGPGSERLVNTVTANTQATHAETRQSVAKDYDGNGVVVWTDTDAAGDDNVFAQRFHTDAAGNPVFDGAAIQVNTIIAGDQRNASVAMDADGDFVVTWSSEVATPAGTDWDIMARRFNALGVPLTTNDVLGNREFRVNTHSTVGVDTHRFSSIAMDTDGDFVIAWQSFGQEGSGGGYGIYAQRFRNDGSRVGGVNEVQTINFTAEPAADSTFTVRFGSRPVRTVTVGADPETTAQNIEDALSEDVQVDVTANSPSQFAVTFVGADAGRDVTQLVVTDDGNASFDVNVQTTTGGVSSEFRVNDTTPNNQVEPVVAMDAQGQFVVTWRSYGQDGDSQFPNQSNIYAKLYSAFENIGTASNEVQTLTFAPATGIVPGGSFAIQIGNATSGPISVNGAPNATAIRNGLTQLGFQTQVVDQGGGVFQITFVGTSASRDIPQITIVNNNVQGPGGTVAITPDTVTEGFGAGEFLVNDQQEFNTQRLPHVAMDLDGDFVITWTSYGQDNNGSGYGAGGTAEDGIFARRYSAGGFAAPTGFQVNNFTDGNQRYSSVVLDADGDFTITWTSELQDGSGYSVQARSYRGLDGPQNGALGSEFQVNATTTGNQQFSSIASDGQGQFTIVWSGNGTGDSSGVFLREFIKAADDAGPIVADVIYISDDPEDAANPRKSIRAGATVDQALSSVIVTFGEELDLDSVTSISNWQILRGASPIPDGIQSVTFGFNAATNKWEAVVTFTAEDPTEPALQAGSYTLVARDTILDTSLNFLDGNYDGFQGDDFLLNFTIVVGARPQRPDSIVNPDPNGSQTTDVDSPQSVAVDADGDYVVVWTDSSSGNTDVFARRFNAQGVPQGPAQFRVNETLIGNQTRAAVAIDADGDFIVTWTDYSSDAAGNVVARRFNALGEALGGEFIVNTSAGAQTRSSVAADVNGDFVIVWVATDGSGEGVVGRRFNFLGEAQGPEFRVNTTTAGSQRQAQVAMNADGAFTVVWSGNGVDAVTSVADATGIFARRFQLDGTAIGGEILINTTTAGAQTLPRVASTLEGEFVVTWTSAGQDGSQEGVYFQLFDLAGAPVGVETRANVTTDGSQRESAVAFDHLGNFTIVWSGNGTNIQVNNDDEGIFARRFSGTGASLAPPSGVPSNGDEFRVNTTTPGPQFAPYVGASGAGDLVFTWTSVNPTNAVFGADVFRRQFDELNDPAGPIVADVVAGGQQIRINSPGSPFDVVDNALTQLTVTFGEEMSVAGGPTGPNSIENPANWVLSRNNTAIPGAVSSVVFRLNAATGKYEAVLTLDGNGFAGAGAPSLTQGNYELQLRESVRDIFDNSLDGDYDNVPGGNFIANFIIGVAQPGDAVVNPISGGSQSTSVDSPQSVAVDADGDYVVVWTDSSNGESNVFFRRFNAQGVPVGPSQVAVNTTVAGNQNNAAVAIDADGDFIVTWTDYNLDPFGNIIARRFNAAGQPRGGEFLVNTSQGVQSRSSIAVDVNGDFVIAWVGNDGGGDGVFARRFNFLEAPQGPEFLVNTTTAASQRQPQVAMNAQGGFTVVWSGAGTDAVTTQADGTGVFARTFLASGTPITGEVLVNSTVGGAQSLPRIANTLSGESVVTWTSAGQDGSQEGVYFQLFDIFGNRVGVETQANLTTDGPQRESFAAFDHLGNFTIVWRGNGANDDEGIFARRFDSTGASLPPPDGVTGATDEFRVNTTTLGPQLAPAVGSSGAGDLVFAWTSVNPNDPNIGAEVVHRRLDELEDQAGPIVSDVAFGPQQIRINAPGSPPDVLDLTVTQLTVSLGEQMSITGGAAGLNSILNPGNWILTRDGTAVLGAVTSVSFNFNPISNKWEALLALDGNGLSGPGSPALPAGAYTLTLRDLVRDVADNSLDGDYDNIPGGNFVVNFLVAPAEEPEVLVNTVTAGGQRTSIESQKAIGVDADGDFVVVWTSSDGSGDGVFAQRFNAAGQKLGGEILVNNTTALDQRQAAVAVDADGDFIVSWTSYGQNGDAAGQGNIFARRFSANGVARGNEFLVNARTEFSQKWSSIATDVDGDFVITWTGVDANNDEGVFAQQFNSLGARLGGELFVNTTTVGFQRLSRVAMDADGDFVIVWTTADPTTPTSTGLLFGRKFNANGTDLLDQTTGLPVGEFNVVPGFTSFDQASVAMDMVGNFAVAFKGDRVGGIMQDTIGVAIFNAQATIVVTDFIAPASTLGDKAQPSVAMDHNGDIVVTWAGSGDRIGQEDSYGIFARRFDLAGNPLPPPPSVVSATDEWRVNTTVPGIQSTPSVGVTGDGNIVIAWTGTGAGDADGVFVRRFDIPGDDDGPIVADVLFGATQVVPGATLNGNVTQLTVTFGEQMITTGDIQSVTNPANWDLIVNGAVQQGAITNISFNLNPATNKWEAVLSLDGNGSGAGTVPLPSGTYILRASSFLQDNFGNLLDGNFDGQPQGTFTRTFNVAGVVPPGPPGTPRGDEFRVNTNLLLRQETADMAGNAGGGFVVVWSGFGQDGDAITDTNVYGQLYDANGARVGAEFRVNRSPGGGLVNLETGNQNDPAVAMNSNGDFVVVWAGVGTGEMQDRHGVYAQRYNQFGTPSGNPVLVNPIDNVNIQAQPAVAMDDNGNFVVTWTTNGSQDDIIAQRFDALGNKLGGPFNVNTNTNDRQEQSRVAMDADGDFVVTWDSYGQDGGSWGVFAQRFSNGGAPQGGNFQVNQFATNTQRDSSVAMDPAGNFVVSWTSFNQDGGGYGVYARSYSAAGAAQGNEFRVNNTTANHQRYSDVDISPAGTFVVTWTSFGQDGEVNGIYARGFGANGASMGNEFQVNRVVAGEQTSSEVAVDNAGNFVIAWTTPDGDTTGIGARRFFSFTQSAAGGSPLASTVGLFAPAASGFLLKNSNSPGAANEVFNFGPAGSGWQPLIGDWDGDGFETAGLYNPSMGAFFLKNGHSAGAADVAFFFGPANAGLIAIAGDWNGDGRDTIGLYSRTSGAFFLRNSNDTGVGDEAFFFGPGGTNWLPIAGNWDSLGGDTVGLYSPNNSAFFLRNVHAPGAADAAFFYGPANAGWLPIAGDWNADGSDTIGLFAPGSSSFFLRNSNTTGIGEVVFSYGPAGAGWLPLAGDFNGAAALMLDGEAVVNSDAASLTAGELQPIVDEAIARWAATGLSDAQIATLRSASVQITDLPGLYLGVTEGNAIYLDRNAAGHGWFVDSTPGADEEFAGGIAANATIYRQVDLLTVVSHEMGHLLGLEDLDPLGHEADLMAESLSVGHRRLASEDALDAVFGDEAW